MNDETPYDETPLNRPLRKRSLRQQIDDSLLNLYSRMFGEDGGVAMEEYGIEKNIEEDASEEMIEEDMK